MAPVRVVVPQLVVDLVVLTVLAHVKLLVKIIVFQVVQERANQNVLTVLHLI